MSLNIKNERVHDLAREAARRTGMSQTSVIEVALERLLADMSDEGAIDRLIAGLQKDVATHGRLSTHDLYDEAGAPR
jgi:antitoxin VapB